MRVAGFDGFERGERGSTTEHLKVLDYKIQQDTILVAELEKEITEKEKAVSILEKDLKTVQGKVLTIKQIEKIPVRISRPILGGSDGDVVSVSKKDWDNVKKTALTQAHKEEKYRIALNENAALKKKNPSGVMINNILKKRLLNWKIALIKIFNTGNKGCRTA